MMRMRDAAKTALIMESHVPEWIYYDVKWGGCKLGCDWVLAGCGEGVTGEQLPPTGPTETRPAA
jgi:hypothetical protein